MIDKKQRLVFFEFKEKMLIEDIIKEVLNKYKLNEEFDVYELTEVLDIQVNEGNRDALKSVLKKIQNIKYV